MILVTDTVEKEIKVEKALRQVLFLKTVREEAIARIAASGQTQTLEKGEMLFAELTRCRGLFVMLDGAVKVYKTDSRGRELTLSVHLLGSSVGDLPLFDGGNYPYSAEAAQADTKVFFVPRLRFREIMHGCPEIGDRALLALGIQLRQMIQIAEAQSLYSVRSRLAAYLLEAAHGQTQFRLEETNEAISSQLGTVREVISRTLRTLKEANLIGLQGRSVSLLNLEELERVAKAD